MDVRIGVTAVCARRCGTGGGAGPVSATTAWLWPPSASWAQTGLPPDVGGFGCGMGPCGESSPTGDSLEDVHAAGLTAAGAAWALGGMAWARAVAGRLETGGGTLSGGAMRTTNT